MKFNLSKQNVYVFLEVLFLLLALIAGCALGWYMFSSEHNIVMLAISGFFFTVFLLITLALMLDPDHIRASQTAEVLSLASTSAEAMQNGLSMEGAQIICKALYEHSTASAVAITDTEVVLGYYGYGSEDIGKLGGAIRTASTRASLQDGKTRVLTSSQEVGLPKPIKKVQAAIIVPLKVEDTIRGTLKMYFARSTRISETQVSIAEGFAQLISTQIASSELEEQKKLATSMELKALQNQINPHFLFNTINTMASYVRTDPEKARLLLREFAVFYRRTLENDSDLISFPRELDQVVRYIGLEQARFGEERLGLDIEVEENTQSCFVPSFMIQPLVENSVKHAMPAEGKLTITVRARMEGDDIRIVVSDDGIGMSEEALENIMNKRSETGLGIAVKNVNARLRGYYGPESFMQFESKLGEGTDVTLFLKNCTKIEP